MYNKANNTSWHYVTICKVKIIRIINIGADFNLQQTVVNRQYHYVLPWTHTHTFRFNGHFSRWTWVYGMGKYSRNFFQADQTLAVTAESHPPSASNTSPKQQNLSTFSSDIPLPISRSKSVLSPSVIGLLYSICRWTTGLHYTDFLSLHYIVYQSISCNHGTK